ncbi:lactococcin 972 family bacteriocin [Actinotignum urinale]|uniref:lactococcin 972 family bacteriocin n=1 Tax=Actinotignum urinale TaxID=190146 RepID=UPI0035327F8D
MKKTISWASIALIILTPFTAFAAVQYPAEGGVWEYGNGRIIAYSYYTVNRVHGSSITRYGEMKARSVRTYPGQKSIAEKWHAPWTGGFRYHYRIY